MESDIYKITTVEDEIKSIRTVYGPLAYIEAFDRRRRCIDPRTHLFWNEVLQGFGVENPETFEVTPATAARVYAAVSDDARFNIEERIGDAAKERDQASLEWWGEVLGLIENHD